MASIAFAAFEQGGTPRITLVNKAKTPLGVELEHLRQALQLQVSRDFAPRWNLNANLDVSDHVPSGSWGLILTDDADEAGALGYHDTTVEGLPQGHVFVRTSVEDGEIPSVTASHELLEMLLDPAINEMVVGPDGTIYAKEASDAVQGDVYAIAGVPVSNFVFPSWFGMHAVHAEPVFDHLRLCKFPFEIRPDGYMPVFTQGGWSQIFGSKAAEEARHRRHRVAARSRGSVRV